jgi:hypothetical protein
MKNQIDNYTSLVYSSSSDRIALCLIRDKEIQHRFLSVGDIERFIPYLRAMNVRGWNIHVTPSVLRDGAVRRTKANFLETQDIIYIDADYRQAMEKVKSDYPYPSLVVKTSVGRYQIYWKLVEAIPIAKQEKLMQAIVRDVGADPAATDVSRVLRLPSFWNRKPSRNNTVDIVFNRAGKTPYKSLSRAFTPSYGNTLNAHSDVLRASSACANGREVVWNSEGRIERFVFPSKSEEDWYLVNQMLRDGASRNECVAFLSARRHGEKKNPDAYAAYAVDKAIRMKGGVSCV